MAGPRPERIQALPLLVFLINAITTSVVMMYSSLNLRPDLPAGAAARPESHHRTTLYLTVLLPTVASTVYLWPVSQWLRTVWARRAQGAAVEVPAPIG